MNENWRRRRDCCGQLVDSAQRIYELADKRFNNGIDGYFSVLDAQRSKYSAQKALIDLDLLRHANKARLYAVLGGGVEYN